MRPELLLISSSSTGLALGLARLKVFALIPATIVFSLIATIVCVVIGLQWGAIACARRSFYLRTCERLKMARLGPFTTSAIWLLSGAERTSQ